MTETLKIYVACLAAYNGGTLHGAWIDAAQEPDEIYAEVKKMLAASPEPGAEEWAIHDYDGFGSLRLGEWEQFSTISAIAQATEEKGEAMLGFLAHAQDNTNLLDEPVEEYDLTEAFDAAVRGAWESENDIVYSAGDEIGLAGVPSSIPMPTWNDQNNVINVFDELSSYIDWDSVVTAFFQHGEYTAVKTSDYKVWVFEDDC